LSFYGALTCLLAFGIIWRRGGEELDDRCEGRR
jgi:hypothetical protein